MGNLESDLITAPHPEGERAGVNDRSALVVDPRLPFAHPVAGKDEQVHFDLSLHTIDSTSELAPRQRPCRAGVERVGDAHDVARGRPGGFDEVGGWQVAALVRRVGVTGTQPHTTTTLRAQQARDRGWGVQPGHGPPVDRTIGCQQRRRPTPVAQHGIFTDRRVPIRVADQAITHQDRPARRAMAPASPAALRARTATPYPAPANSRTVARPTPVAPPGDDHGRMLVLARHQVALPQSTSDSAHISDNRRQGI